MKKIILCFVVLLGLESCSDQLAISENENVTQPANQVDDEYHYYLEKARWGDATAYVKLADFYREGKYVKADFIGMTAMLAMAEQYDGNHRLKDYLKALPEEDSYRQMFEAMDEIDRKDRDKVKNVASVLVANGKPEGYVINGAMQVEEGDTIGGLETIRYGAEQGSSSKIDTGSGVYESKSGKLVKDHNWRRGGYGEITLEDALTHRSEVGLTKAIEQAYGNDRQAYESQINFYLNGEPNNLMGMLTFYNAIANGGKMVKISHSRVQSSRRICIDSSYSIGFIVW